MPALGFSYPFQIQVLDYSGERKSIQNLFLSQLTSANFDDYETDRAAFITALDGIVLGTISRVGYGGSEVISNNKPASKQAQIETEILVSMRDNVTQEPFSFRIPTADYDAHNYGTGDAGDEVVISGAGATAATLAFVAAANAHLKSPFDAANAAIVTGMRIVK